MLDLKSSRVCIGEMLVVAKDLNLIDIHRNITKRGPRQSDPCFFLHADGNNRACVVWRDQSGLPILLWIWRYDLRAITPLEALALSDHAQITKAEWRLVNNSTPLRAIADTLKTRMELTI